MNRREVMTTLDICSYLIVALGLLYYFIFDVKIGEGLRLVIVVACAFLHMLIRKYFFGRNQNHSDAEGILCGIHPEQIFCRLFFYSLNLTRFTIDRPNVSSSVYSRSFPIEIPLARVLIIRFSLFFSFLKI